MSAASSQKNITQINIKKKINVYKKKKVLSNRV